MTELPLVFLGGLLGAGHCVGMCGGFAMAIGWQSPTLRRNLGRQLCYSCGRLTTYSFLGAVAGYAGLRVSSMTASLVSIQAALSVLAGLFLLVQGLVGLGWWPQRWKLHLPAEGCPGVSQFRALVSSRSNVGVLLAGVFTGFLPCGLIYAFLALAVSSGSVVQGVSIMATLGLGTLPLMLLTGLGGSLASAETRRRLIRLAACAVLLIGGLTTTRGVAGLITIANGGQPDCPFCSSPTGTGISR